MPIRSRAFRLRRERSSMGRMPTEKSMRKQSRFSCSAVCSNFDSSDASIFWGTPYMLAEESTQTIIGPRRAALSVRNRRDGWVISDLYLNTCNRLVTHFRKKRLSKSESVYWASSVGIRAFRSRPMVTPSMSLPEEWSSWCRKPVCTGSRSFPSSSGNRPILRATSPICGYLFCIWTICSFFSNSDSIHWPAIMFQAWSASASVMP